MKRNSENHQNVGLFSHHFFFDYLTFYVSIFASTFDHRFGGFGIHFDSILASFFIIFASLFRVVFFHRFRIDFLSIFAPSERQKPYFYYSISKVFAKSPFREKDRFCISFGTISASLSVHFGIIFRDFFGIDFCIDF